MTDARADIASGAGAEAQGVFTSIFQAARALKFALRPELERAQLTTPMFWALHELAGDGTMSVGSIATACAVTSANISAAIEDLVRASLVRRSTSAKDRRIAMLTATAKGRALDRTVWARAVERLAVSLEDVPRSDLETTARVVGRLSHSPGVAPSGEEVAA